MLETNSGQSEPENPPPPQPESTTVIINQAPPPEPPPIVTVVAPPAPEPQITTPEQVRRILNLLESLQPLIQRAEEIRQMLVDLGSLTEEIMERVDNPHTKENEEGTPPIANAPGTAEVTEATLETVQVTEIPAPDLEQGNQQPRKSLFHRVIF